MKHISYNSIENHYQAKVISRFKEMLSSTNDQFVVQEKLHGANFSIYWNPLNPEELRYGSRNEFVVDGFYSYKRAIANIGEDKILTFFKSYHGNRVNPVDTYYILYGELIGGNYHKNIKGIAGVKSVQKEVFYSIDNQVVFFDLFVCEDETPGFEDVVNLNKRLQIYGLPYLPIRFQGTFEECLTQVEEYDSEVYKIYHPDLVIESNSAEGLVIKQKFHDIVNCPERVVLKKKSLKFKENVRDNSTPKEPKVVDENVQLLVSSMLPLLNENRVNSLFSKHQNLEMKMIPTLAGELMVDLTTDFEKETMLLLDDKTYKAAKTILYKECIGLVKGRILTQQ